MYSNGTPHMAEQMQDDQLEPTYSNSVRIRNVALRTCQKRWTIGRSGERGSGISVLATQHDIYIYIYMYVCMCVCECESRRERIDRKVHGLTKILSRNLTKWGLFFAWSGRLAEIRCIWKSQRILCVSFSRMNSWLCIYHLFVWSNL